MTVRITFKPVYTVVDTNHKEESFDVVGIEGLDKHAENCLGGFVDKLYSECYTGNNITTKLNIHKFLLKNKLDLETVFELFDGIDELKRMENEDE